MNSSAVESFIKLAVRPHIHALKLESCLVYIIYPENSRACFVTSNKFSIIRKRKRGRRITIFKASFICLHCCCEFGVWLLVCLVVRFFSFFFIWLLFLYLQFLKLFEPKQHLPQFILVIRKVSLILFILSENKSRLWA